MIFGFLEKKRKEDKIIIKPFGRTFNNIDLELLYDSVKTKTILENSKRYKDQENLTLKLSSISSSGKFKIISSEHHLNPIEPLQQFEYD
jgi:hypothetical protein